MGQAQLIWGDGVAQRNIDSDRLMGLHE